MTDFKVGDRVLRNGEPGEVVSVLGDDNDQAWAMSWALAEEGETYLVVLDSDPDNVYYARPGDIEEEA